MKIALVVLMLFLLPSPAQSASATLVHLVPQEKVIDGPGEDDSEARQFDLDEADFDEADGDRSSRRQIELILGVAFLVGVVLLGVWRRGREAS